MNEDYYSKAIPNLEEIAHFSDLTKNKALLEFYPLQNGDTKIPVTPPSSITKLAFSRSLQSIADWAIEYLHVIHAVLGADFVAQNCSVTMDIDDTIITRNSSSLNEVTSVTTKDTAFTMLATKRIFETCMRLKFTVYFITARPDYPSNVQWTKDELKEHGFSGYRDLFMISADAERNDTIGSEYKRKARNIIETRDQKNIVLNIGDRWSDLLLYPEGDRADGRIHAHNPETRPDSLAFGLVKHTPPFWNYVAILPDTSWVSIKIADA
jgi:hypothetical protein